MPRLVLCIPHVARGAEAGQLSTFWVFQPSTSVLLGVGIVLAVLIVVLITLLIARAWGLSFRHDNRESEDIRRCMEELKAELTEELPHLGRKLRGSMLKGLSELRTAVSDNRDKRIGKRVVDDPEPSWKAAAQPVAETPAAAQPAAATSKKTAAPPATESSKKAAAQPAAAPDSPKQLQAAPGPLTQAAAAGVAAGSPSQAARRPTS